MNQPIVESPDAVTLIAGGPCTARDLALALRHAPVLVAADGGADRALGYGLKLSGGFRETHLGRIGHKD